MPQQPTDRASWLSAGAQACAGGEKIIARPWRIVLLGQPGAGERLQADRICREFGACYLSVDDLLGTARCNDACGSGSTPAVNLAVEYARAHRVVTDALILELIRERTHCLTCSRGFVLDGFPKTVEHALALDAVLDAATTRLDAVIYYHASEDVLIERLSGRRVCSLCGEVYYICTKPPGRPGVCDICRGELTQHVDDKPDFARLRLRTYAASIAPLLAQYGATGLLRRIPSEGSPDQIFNLTTEVMRAVAAAGK